MSDLPQRRIDGEPPKGEVESMREDPLRQLLYDVPVPAELESRLLAQLALTASSPLAVRGSGKLGSADATPRGVRPGRFSRRVWLSTAAVAGGALLGYGWYRRPIREATVLSHADAWLDDWEPTWSGVPTPAADVSGIPLPRALRRRGPYPWQYFSTEFSSRTVVYELRDGSEALLFAIATDRDLSSLPTSPPATVPAQTGSWIRVTWQESSRYLFVFALRRRSAHFYDQLLRVQSLGVA